MSCFLGVIIGLVNLGLTTPNFKAISEGREAGKIAYDVIFREPNIKLDDDKSISLKDVKGEFEFKNVTFSYPSRKD
jgi:hypothetical protein